MATALHSTSSVNWAIVAPGVTAIAAVVALLVRELQRRREDLDQKVQNAVSASIGRTLLEYREFEGSVRASLEGSAKTAAEIEGQLRERLNLSEAHSSRLASLLDKASDLVPRLERSRSTVPSMLLAQALRADPTDALDALATLLHVDRVSSVELERAGDIAQQRFGAYALAADLYQKATELDPGSASAVASLLLIQVTEGQVSREEARVRLAQLARENPFQRNALSSVMNFYSRTEDYEGMLALTTELIALNAESVLLWRNQAIAQMRLDQSADAYTAFKRSIDLAAAQDDAAELANAARPYVRQLLRDRRYDDAEAILARALHGVPDEPQLLEQLGELWEKRNDVDRARRAYQFALASPGANPSEVSDIETALARLEARKDLASAEVIDGLTSTPADESAAVDVSHGGGRSADSVRLEPEPPDHGPSMGGGGL